MKKKKQYGYKPGYVPALWPVPVIYLSGALLRSV